MVDKKRLIDANELLELYDIEEGLEQPSGGWYIPIPVVRQNIKDMPTVDAVEVVRCSDCRYCDPENSHCDHWRGTHIPISRRPDDFCSYGKRKDDDGRRGKEVDKI